MDVSLFKNASFPEVGHDGWLKLARKAIGDADFDATLVSRTDDGIRILSELMPRIQQSAADAEGDFAVGPVLLEGDRPMFGLRVRTELAEPRAEIFAAFDPAIALRALLDEHALGYGLRITVGEQEIYRRVPRDVEMMLDLTYSDSVALGVGQSWSLSAWPTSTSVLAFYDQGLGVRIARKHIAWSIDAVFGPEAREQRKAICTLTDPKAVREALLRLFEEPERAVAA